MFCSEVLNKWIFCIKSQKMTLEVNFENCSFCTLEINIKLVLASSNFKIVPLFVCFFLFICSADEKVRVG